jgi:hypothetical protein
MIPDSGSFCDGDGRQAIEFIGRPQSAEPICVRLVKQKENSTTVQYALRSG